jgi:hypothetical protein
MSAINTTHGRIEESHLARTVGFEDRPGEFVVWVEWRKPCVATCVVCADPSNPQPDAQGVVLVRRDAHCILKEPSVVADALAASLG